MYKVEFWSRLLDKYVIKKFDTLEEATAFAAKVRGILMAGSVSEC